MLISKNLEAATVADRVLNFLRRDRSVWGEWYTLSAISQATGLSVGQVNGVVYDMVNIGVVELERPQPRRGQAQQRYRWRA